MINLVISPAYKSKISKEDLENVVFQVLKDQTLQEDADLSIVIAGNKKIRQLNLEFRGIDAPTDVLSFPDDEVDPDTGKRYLGDIVISFPYAQKQAEDEENSLEDELRLLVVHGTLHLLGYDHVLPEEKKAMWVVQSRILDQLGVKINI
jgi:probable rRNA maturation factor